MKKYMNEQFPPSIVRSSRKVYFREFLAGNLIADGLGRIGTNTHLIGCAI